jgi:hypothetical protein
MAGWFIQGRGLKLEIGFLGTEATERSPREPLSFVTRDRIVRPTFDCSEGGETVLD